MPLPFPDFAEPVLAEPLAFNVLPYSEFAALSAEATTLGEVAAVSAEVATAAVLLEPALVIGAGVLAALAAEEILKNLNKTDAPPKVRPKLPSGGRVSGGSFARIHLETTIYGVQEYNQAFGGFLLGIGVGIGIGVGSIRYILQWTNGFAGIIETQPENIIVAPYIVEYHYNTNAPPYPEIGQPLQNPGNLTINAPTTVNINLPDGTTTPISPRAYPSPRNDPSVKPFAPVSPGVLVVSPEIGIAFNFNPTNVQIIYFQPGDSETTSPAPNYTTQPYKLPQGQKECPPDANSAQILCRVKALEKGLLDDGYTYATHSGTSGQTGLVTGITGEVFALHLEVTSVADNERKQLFPSPSPDVYFFGWIAWTVNGKPGLRQPVSFLSTTFRAPPDADGFMYGFHTFCSATATYVTRVKKDYVDAC